MERVIDVLYRISNDMHSFLNGYGSFNDEIYWSKGKFFESSEEAVSFFDPNPQPIVFESFDENGNSIGGWRKPVTSEEVQEMTDCRFDYVDIEMKQLIYDRLCMNVLDFLKEENSEDEFLLVLGFAINLYYVVGLYSTYGKFDVNKILEYVEFDDIKEYGNLINEFLYSKFFEGIVDRCHWLDVEDVDSFNETIKAIENNENQDVLDCLYKNVKKHHWNYIPDLYMAIKEGNSCQDSQECLDKMIDKYPDFRFGLVYQCIQKGLNFYKTEGEDIEVANLKDKLGSELYLHTLGLKPLDHGKYDVVDGKIQTVRSAVFSEFGLGIPKINTVSKNDYYLPINDILEGDESKKTVTLTNIRKQTETVLGINVISVVEDNPLSYTGKLFEVVEQQRKNLEMQNQELLRLNLQRRNMIDHLAHSWGNECYPEIVKKVAEELLKSGNSSLANKLFKAYNSENNLMGEIIFLQSAMEDEPSKLKDIFKDSFYVSSDDGKKEGKIISVIEEALDNLVFSLLNYNGDKEKRLICRNKLCTKYSLNQLAEDYAKRFESVETSGRETFFQWFSRNIFEISISIDECWRKINFSNNKEYGKIVVKNVFTELFTNILFHGEGPCEVILDSQNDRMFIKVKNRISKNVVGSKKGLSGLRELISKLNYDTVVAQDECLSYGINDDGIFETVVVFAKDLMFIDEEW